MRLVQSLCFARYLPRAVIVSAIFSLTVVSSAFALTPGVDDFEDGTTNNWAVGPSPNPPVNSADGGGGPAGADDNFMRLTSTGTFSAGGRLAVFNRTQWTGDLLALDPQAFQLDVRNPGDTDVMLRIAFQNSSFDSFGSQSAVSIRAMTDWQTVLLPITPDDLVSHNLFGTYEEVLSDIIETRLLSSEERQFMGDQIIATLDVDNIRLITGVVPEPGSLALAAMALSLGLLPRRRFSIR